MWIYEDHNSIKKLNFLQVDPLRMDDDLNCCWWMTSPSFGDISYKQHITLSLSSLRLQPRFAWLIFLDKVKWLIIVACVQETVQEKCANSMNYYLHNSSKELISYILSIINHYVLSNRLFCGIWNFKMRSSYLRYWINACVFQYS